MRRRGAIGGLLLALLTAPHPASAAEICTLVLDVTSGRTLHEVGDCDRRTTPASTFKLPLAVMGFDAGVLRSPTAPVWTMRAGEPDWGGAAWRQPVDPARWLKHSVVWYSQRIAKALGSERLTRAAAGFGLGNADFTGDPGKGNGLERAWISSSLLVSPREQAAFLRRFVRRELPAGREAMDLAAAIVEATEAGSGWTIHGKTGSAFPRRADGGFDRARGWGWFVGWAVKESRALAFVRLIQDERSTPGSTGLRARDGLIADWPKLAAGAP